MQRLMIIPILFMVSIQAFASGHEVEPEFSKAGFWEVENSGREVFNFNIGWRFMKADIEGAHAPDFDDSDWDVVNCPHGLEYNSTEASGSSNYQGPAWYRKHFTVDKDLQEKLLKLHFEAVMGKCKIWLNGEQIGEHYGGYLPFIVTLSGKLNPEGDNVLAVWADNSNDETYPPGKPQNRLDFTYFGGIYRDVWLVATNRVYVSDPNEADRIAGGGIFARTESVSETSATLAVSVDIQNDNSRTSKLTAKLDLYDPEGSRVASASQSISVKAGRSAVVRKTLKVSDPALWAPLSPELYRLEVLLTDASGQNIDGVALRVGLRTIEFKGREGFFLNNKPYPGKLMGANRHQDHGYVGNALPNNGQWRDALILKKAACDVIRAAHYPADPAFMDACDALGMFYIDATPGWQFWNEDPVFAERVYDDIRNMVRRNRNRASVLLWEPILNEAGYPNHFAKTAHEVVHEEFPYPGAYTVSDRRAEGNEYYDVVYAHDYNLDFLEETRCTFTREFGDCVDDFNAQNSPSRVAREWGEAAQLVQARHYAHEPFEFTTWESLHKMPPQHFGGTLWHAFDHQRGYHCDPFYGGLTDVFRQPKYSYHMFASQRDVSDNTEPFIYIAHEMTPFSGPDVNVFTNCDEVRLTLHEGQAVLQKTANVTTTKIIRRKRTEPRTVEKKGIMAMPHPVVTFEDVYKFIETKYMHTAGRKYESSILAEGLIDGRVVASHRRVAAKRPTSLVLRLEDFGVPMTANGADFVLVQAYVADEKGVLKRLHENSVRFEVEGEGQIIGDASIEANPRRLRWGTAPLLVRSTTSPGKIMIRASLVSEGINSPLPAELEIESLPSADRFIHTEAGKESYEASAGKIIYTGSDEELRKRLRILEKELMDLKLKEEEQNQLEFDQNR